MKTEDILKLKDAGFSNDDIIRFASAYDETLPEAPQETPVIPETQTATETIPAWADAFAKQIGALTKTIQAMNTRSVNIPATTQKDPADILGEVIAPPQLKKGQ